MLRKLLLSVALTVTMAPAAAQQQNSTAARTATATVPVTAAQLASALQDMVGQEFEGGIRLHAVASEGNTLVITANGPDGWRQGSTRAMLSDALVVGFCSSMPDYFEFGRTMRVDTIDRKVKWKGPLVKACPPPESGAN